MQKSLEREEEEEEEEEYFHQPPLCLVMRAHDTGWQFVCQYKLQYNNLQYYSESSIKQLTLLSLI